MRAKYMQILLLIIFLFNNLFCIMSYFRRCCEGFLNLTFHIHAFHVHTLHIHTYLNRRKCFCFEYPWSGKKKLIESLSPTILKNFKIEKFLERKSILELEPKTFLDKLKQIRRFQALLFYLSPRYLTISWHFLIKELVSHDHLNRKIPKIPYYLSIHHIIIQLLFLHFFFKGGCLFLPSKWRVNWKLLVIVN